MGTESQSRRIYFYGKFGIKFDFTRGDAPCDISQPMRACDLVEVSFWKDTITEVSAVAFLRERVHESEHNAADVAYLRRSLSQDGIILRQAYQQPVEWMFQRLVTDNLARTCCVVALSVVTGLGLYRAF